MKKFVFPMKTEVSSSSSSETDDAEVARIRARLIENRRKKKKLTFKVEHKQARPSPPLPPAVVADQLPHQYARQPAGDIIVEWVLPSRLPPIVQQHSTTIFVIIYRER